MKLKTQFAFEVAVSGSVSLRVFDMQGKQVRVLADGTYGVRATSRRRGSAWTKPATRWPVACTSSA